MSTPPTDDARNALVIHNTARATQNLPVLTWDDDLSHQATEYANWLSTAGVGLQHSSGDSRTNQGENLFMENGMQNPASVAAQSWVNEVANYHGETVADGDFESYGHYTQVMWSSTKTVGLGYATGQDGWVYVVGRYSPQGNIEGSKPF